jgi:hypothetical protein
VRVPQGDLAPVRNDGGLAAYEGAQAAVQARLELAGHERVVGARLRQQPEVQLEQAQVEDDGDGRQHHASHLEKKPYESIHKEIIKIQFQEELKSTLQIEFVKGRYHVLYCILVGK